jgi:hypothetical protein
VRSQRVDALDVVVSEHDSPVDAAEANVLAHATVVEAVAKTNDGVLPARFGGMHADEAALREAVVARGELQSTLERVRGCVELGLRVLAEAPSLPAATSGASYMRARLDQRRTLERLADEIHRPLAQLARDATVTVASTPRLLLTAAYLVERDRIEAVERELAGLQSQHPDLTVVLTGPWPPYTFAIAEGGGP